MKKVVALGAVCALAAGVSIAPPAYASSPGQATPEFTEASLTFLAAARLSQVAATSGLKLRAGVQYASQDGTVNTVYDVSIASSRPSQVKMSTSIDGEVVFTATEGSVPTPGRKSGLLDAYSRLTPKSAFDKVQLGRLPGKARYSLGSAPEFSFWAEYYRLGFTSEQILGTVTLIGLTPWAADTLIAQCGRERAFVKVSCEGSTDVSGGIRSWVFDVTQEAPEGTWRAQYRMSSNELGFVTSMDATQVGSVVGLESELTSRATFSTAGATTPNLAGGRSVPSTLFTARIADAAAKKWGRDFKREVVRTLDSEGLPVTPGNVRSVAARVDANVFAPVSAWVYEPSWNRGKGGVRLKLTASDAISVTSGRVEVVARGGKVVLRTYTKLLYPSVDTSADVNAATGSGALWKLGASTASDSTGLDLLGGGARQVAVHSAF